MEFPKLLIFLGITLVIIGILWIFLGRFIPLGKLPGDFSYEKGNTKFYFPLATSIVLSILLTLLFYVLQLIRK